jgi:sulfonate transport system ATP-binding protein
MAWFEARNLSKKFQIGPGNEITALDRVFISAERGDFVSIVGRSGSGKTTFLRMVAGLEEIAENNGTTGESGGEIVYDQENAPKIGVVFQEPRLMPWLTVEKNILFPFLKSRQQADLAAGRARELLRMLGLDEFASAYPSQLSGGMAQRAALGRALCFNPELILMDEPFSALDYFTRRALQDEIMKLYLSSGLNIFFVTHDVEEAIALSGRIVVLDRGQVAGEIPVPLPYPRKRTSPDFSALMDEVLSVI